MAAALWCAAAGASAQEPWLLTVEGGAAVPVGAPQGELFGVGGAGAVGLHRPLGGGLSIGGRLRGVLLSDRAAPDDPGRVDPGIGGVGTASLALRLRPLGAGAGDPRRAVGPFVEAAGGVGLTGALLRPALELGLGWGIDLGAVAVAPTVRYLQLLQPDDDLDGRDARLLLLGLEVTFFDAALPPPAPPPPPPPPPPPGDRDGDGIVDPEDLCPDEPEDHDGFEDGDGCPDPDNDQDGIPDPIDACPDEPEDFDGFEDEDGCPDPDNDGDGILDPDDACPNEPEVINGVDDHDGCPDEGLIELVDDRIVIEESVLFAYDRAFVRPNARPILEAIVHLWRQHPEWSRVRIEGHTDLRGSADYNQRLSEHRARAVMEALVARGMARDILESVGYGETRPLNRGTREATHRRNRRVELVVIARRAVPAGDDPAPQTVELELLEAR